MKRIGAFVLSIIMLLSFAACSSGKIEGRWTGSAPAPFLKGELEGADYSFLDNTTITYKLLFEDGEYVLSRGVSIEQQKAAVKGYKKLYLEYYNLKHKDKAEIERLMQEANCKTEEELIDNLLLAAALKKNFASIDTFVCSKLGIDNRVLGSGKYEKDGDVIRLFSGDDTSKPLFEVTINDDQMTLANGDSPVAMAPDSLD